MTTSHAQRIECLSPEAYKVHPDRVKYLDHGGMLGMYDKVAFNVPMILVGPKGVGKSLSVFAYAALRGIPLITYSCSEDARASNLVGMLTLRGDETPFVCGPLVAAIETANAVGRAILLLEEINALTPQMQKLLNGITDFRKRIEAPVAGRVFDLRPDAQLWVVGTMNFSAYGGVNALNEDLKSRFAMLPLGYPPSDDERALVTAELGALKARLTEDVINKAMRFAAETRAPEFSYALSPRDVVIWLRTIAAADLPTGLWMLMGRFEDTDVALAQTRLAAIFGNTALALYQRQIATSRRPG